jgi:hypothetical protein
MGASHRDKRARGLRDIETTLEGITGISKRLLQSRRARLELNTRRMGFDAGRQAFRDRWREEWSKV